MKNKLGMTFNPFDPSNHLTHSNTTQIDPFKNKWVKIATSKKNYYLDVKWITVSRKKGLGLKNLDHEGRVLHMRQLRHFEVGEVPANAILHHIAQQTTYIHKKLSWFTIKLIS